MGIAEKVTDQIITGHNLHIEAPLCSRFRTPKSGCSMCADTCPAGAISISDKGAEITGACIECGICSSVCPNGVFQVKERDDERIIGEIREAAGRNSRGEGKVLRISCERGDGKADLLVPCLGRLTEALLVEPVRTGFAGIDIIRPDCAECPNSKASLHIDKLLNRVFALYEMVNIERERLAIRRMPLQPPVKRPEKAVSRREFFSALRTKAAAVAATSLPEISAGGDAREQSFLEAISKRPGNSKRMLLIQALGEFAPVKEVCVPPGEVSLAEITVSSHCTACGVCATLCPTGALTQGWSEEQFCLSFRPSLCTNCRVCAETCMPKAISTGETARLNHLLEDKELRVFEAERKQCSLCRMDFVQSMGSRQSSEGVPPGLPPGICPLCIDRHKKQMAFIQNGFMK
ncbi:MAG: 4Fe-4S binding protein [Nitrospirae bacterium]|nr:4Fe-4S binding protein [Nitrospirota bacterium]